MKVLSIDVGIKNLAYILIEHNENDSNYNIIDWNVLNLCNFVPNCCNEKCKFKAKFGKEDKFFCKKHTKSLFLLWGELLKNEQFLEHFPHELAFLRPRF